MEARSHCTGRVGTCRICASAEWEYGRCCFVVVVSMRPQEGHRRFASWRREMGCHLWALLSVGLVLLQYQQVALGGLRRAGGKRQSAASAESSTLSLTLNPEFTTSSHPTSIRDTYMYTSYTCSCTCSCMSLCTTAASLAQLRTMTL